MAGDEPPGVSIARKAYAAFAERYDAIAPTKAHNALYERPATHALLGDVDGLDVLDAGCGSGIGTERLARGGARVSGFDITPEMLALARKRCEGLNVAFHDSDLSQPLDWLADESFDRVLSSLALDYVEHLQPVFREFFRVTRPGGQLVFSMGHPMRDWQDERARGGGTYFETNLWGMHWGGFGEPAPYVQSYRRPLAEIVNGLSESGWIIDRLVEPLPDSAMKRQDPGHFEELSKAPAFLCIRARRP
ncbi:class I SAM-dependent methyltransferase [Mesorhizobium sp. CAU 1732]|uniref:class I SAM-dependent methyltransferase n=1 Tax=Mesorhizobium sp. CAU 1732 TaxID=3140358 RepID=UPI003260AE2A